MLFRLALARCLFFALAGRLFLLAAHVVLLAALRFLTRLLAGRLFPAIGILLATVAAVALNVWFNGASGTAQDLRRAAAVADH